MKQSLFRSTLVVSAMTTLSRVFGMVRDIVIARYFGAGLGMDAFIIAFRIPNFLRRLFAEGGFAQAFVPVLSEYRERRTPAEVRSLLDQTTATLGLALFAATLLGVAAAPVLIMVFAPGFMHDPAKQQLAVSMLRVTFPYILFISLTALAGAVLNAYRRFAVPAFTPVLLNLSMIACALWLAPRFAEPVTALAWGVFIAGVAQLLFQLPFLMRLGLLPRPGFGRDPIGVRRVMKLMLPTLFSTSVSQINLLVDSLIASFLVTGSISWLYYSERLVEFPLGVFGVGLATVIMPSLSGHHATASEQAYSRTLDWALRWVFIISVPAACGLAVLAAPLLATLFQYREFTAHDVAMASRSLIAYSAGLPAYVLVKVLASGFYSRQDTATPVRTGIASMLTNVVLNLALVLPLAHAGLALASSIAAYLNAALLLRTLRRQGHYQCEPGWPGFLLKVFAAAALMSVLIVVIAPAARDWIRWDLMQRLGGCVAAVGGGMLVYFGMLRLFGLRIRRMTAHG
jgi:putative peptidoglycan lipid II flippase